VCVYHWISGFIVPAFDDPPVQCVLIITTEYRMVSKDEHKKQLLQKRKATKKRSQQAKKDRLKHIKTKKFGGKADQGITVEYVAPDLPFSEGDPKYEPYKAIFERFSIKEEDEDDDADEDEEEAKKDEGPKKKVKLEVDDDDDSDDDRRNFKGLSKRQKRLRNRMSVAKLKTLVRRPDVVEACDTTAPNPELLVYLKAYRNTVPVPRHWSSKRRYLAGKRGVEKPPFKLPEYIEATGIAKIRQAIVERDAERSRKATSRLKLQPKMGKLDIDYQVLHDAFFKYSTRPPMSKHNDLYFEGKEMEVKMGHKKPGILSAALKEALAMPDDYPPPWLYNMQRYGPPPSYPSLKIAGLNAPIPFGCEYGFHTGGWGKPPVDEYGQPLYGDIRTREPEQTFGDEGFWGELEDAESEEEEEEMDVEKEGVATPVMGTATPIIGSVTPMVASGIASITGTRSISGVSSITSGVDTGTGTGTGTRTRGVASISGVSSASMTPSGPQLFKVLEEQKHRSGGGVFPSNRGYKMSGQKTPMGMATPGIATPGIATPGIATPGIATPGIASAGIHTGAHTGINTPGIATPGIATPIGGIATPMGGIATPIGGIVTPAGIAQTPVAGMDTPGVAVNLNTSDMEAEGALTADIIRQQLKQHEEQAKKARDKAGQKEATKKKKDTKTNKTAKKFKF